ncbi:restriction endonuclease subunit S [Streptomyces albidoflavus]|uniref:restriction endonuclease subunit S n=1 Tax=Streptomyces albidoflavus TaxID=1886 RepID=UPI002E353F24|nr:restriction endonuclease subunit S [Streptomyces albidoflavus]
MSTSPDVEWVPVRELGEVRTGKQLSPSSREAANQFPYLRVANVHLGRIEYVDVNEMGFTSAERVTYGLKPGDILLNEGQSLELVGRSAIYDRAEGEFCYQNTLIRFRPNGRVLSAYAQLVFEHWLRSGVFAAIAKQTTSIAHLGGDRFAALKFPLLPTGMQQRIVDVLESLAELERGIEASIAKLRSVREGMLLSLATPNGRSGSPMTPLRELLDRLEVGIPSMGPEGVPNPGEWGVMRLGAVTSGIFDAQKIKRIPSQVMVRPELEISRGDVLMVRVNGSARLVGSICVVDEAPRRIMLSDLVMRLVADARVLDPAYLGAVLVAPHVRRQIVSKFRGTSGQFQLPQEELKSIEIPLPSVIRQRQDVAVLAACDRKIAREADQLAKLRQLRAGLVDDLLSERVAVLGAGAEE